MKALISVRWGVSMNLKIQRACSRLFSHVSGIHNFWFGCCIASLFLVASCKKDDPPPPPASPGKYENGLLILNEGLFQQNNASLSYYDLESQQVFTQTFQTENGRGLGDTANDFEKYVLNGKAYILIAVDISSQLEVVEANTLKSVAQIPVFDGTTARHPRRIEIYGTTAFVCNFDGTVSVVDLVTNSIVNTLQTGANPDGMVQVGSNLFVSNSGGLNYPVYDSTMTVIDMNTLTITDTIQTRINSSTLVVDSQQEIYLLSAGNYGSQGPALLRISSVGKTVLQEFNEPITAMTAAGDWLYYYDSDAQAVRRFNLLTETFEGIDRMDGTGFETFFAIQYVPELDLIFCFDAKGYVNSSLVHAYSTSGVFQYSFAAELNAKKVIYNE